jgi:hypothetical protein
MDALNGENKHCIIIIIIIIIIMGDMNPLKSGSRWGKNILFI